MLTIRSYTRIFQEMVSLRHYQTLKNAVQASKHGWSTTDNLLKLNDLKTEVLLLGTNYQKQKVKSTTVCIDNTQIMINRTGAVRNLSVTFDFDVSMKTRHKSVPICPFPP